MPPMKQDEMLQNMHVIHRDGMVFIEDPILRLIGKGTSIQEAYADANKQRESKLAAYRDADILDHLPDLDKNSSVSLGADTTVVPAGSHRSLKSFAVKSGIIAVVILFLTSAVTSQISYQISKTAADLNKNVGGRQFWQKMERQLSKAANPRKETPRERQEKIAADLRKLAVRIKPYIDAISEGLADPASAPKGLPIASSAAGTQTPIKGTGKN